MELQVERLGKVSITVDKNYYNPSKDYDRLIVVEVEGAEKTYISRKPVPAGISINDREYWIPFSSLKEHIIEHYNVLQQELNELYKKVGVGIVFDANYSTYDFGKSKDITLNFSVINTSEEASVVKLYANGVLIDTYNHIHDFTKTITVSSDVTFQVIATIGNYNFSATWRVVAAYDWYIGAGDTYQDVMTPQFVKSGTDDNIGGLWNVLVETTGEHLFICVPSIIAINDVTIDGFTVPFEPVQQVSVDGVPYNIYKSSNTYVIGEYLIRINDGTWNYDDVLSTLVSSLETNITLVNNLSQQVPVLSENVNELNGIVNNIADEEDITLTDENKLKLKNKNYNPSKYTGLGRVYLPKNTIDKALHFQGFVTNVTVTSGSLITIPAAIYFDSVREIFVAVNNIDDPTYYNSWTNSSVYNSAVNHDEFYDEAGENYYEWNETTLRGISSPTLYNVLTQDMMNKENTIYHIQYDYDLNENDIDIPEGCILNFDGGSLSNGIIEGNGTVINSRETIIFDNILINGSWNNEYAYGSWFSENYEDDSVVINNLCTLSRNVILRHQGTYHINNTIYLYKQYSTFNGNGSTFYLEDNLMTSLNGAVCFFVQDSFDICNLNIVSNMVGELGNTQDFKVFWCQNQSADIRVDNVNFTHDFENTLSYITVFFLLYVRSVSIKNSKYVVLTNSRRGGILWSYLHGNSVSYTMENVDIDMYTGDEAIGIYQQHNTDVVNADIYLNNVKINHRTNKSTVTFTVGVDYGHANYVIENSVFIIPSNSTQHDLIGVVGTEGNIITNFTNCILENRAGGGGFIDFLVRYAVSGVESFTFDRCKIKDASTSWFGNISGFYSDVVDIKFKNCDLECNNLFTNPNGIAYRGKFELNGCNVKLNSNRLFYTNSAFAYYHVNVIDTIIVLDENVNSFNLDWSFTCPSYYDDEENEFHYNGSVNFSNTFVKHGNKTLSLDLYSRIDEKTLFTICDNTFVYPNFIYRDFLSNDYTKETFLATYKNLPQDYVLPQYYREGGIIQNFITQASSGEYVANITESLYVKVFWEIGNTKIIDTIGDNYKKKIATTIVYGNTEIDYCVQNDLIPRGKYITDGKSLVICMDSGFVKCKMIPYNVPISGATADRPQGSNIYIGFEYFDTTLGFPIYAKAISGDTVTWVKSDGTSPDENNNI